LAIGHASCNKTTEASQSAEYTQKATEALKEAFKSNTDAAAQELAIAKADAAKKTQEALTPPAAPAAAPGAQ